VSWGNLTALDRIRVCIVDHELEARVKLLDEYQPSGDISNG